jgi:hypothetical protein
MTETTRFDAVLPDVRTPLRTRQTDDDFIAVDGCPVMHMYTSDAPWIFVSGPSTIYTVPEKQLREEYRAGKRRTFRAVFAPDDPVVEWADAWCEWAIGVVEEFGWSTGARGPVSRDGAPAVADRGAPAVADRGAPAVADREAPAIRKGDSLVPMPLVNVGRCSDLCRYEVEMTVSHDVMEDFWAGLKCEGPPIMQEQTLSARPGASVCVGPQRLGAWAIPAGMFGVAFVVTGVRRDAATFRVVLSAVKLELMTAPRPSKRSRRAPVV